EPILGMQVFAEKDPAIAALFQDKAHSWVVAPNGLSGASHHGDFGKDAQTFQSTLARITASGPAQPVRAAKRARGAAAAPAAAMQAGLDSVSLASRSARMADVRKLLASLPRQSN